MAYGFRCSLCGWQETNHTHGILDDDFDEQKRLEGYRYSLKSCPGFTYRQTEQRAVIREFLADPVEELLPDYLHRRVEVWKRRNDIVDPVPNHDVWAVLSNGLVVNIGS